MTDDYHTELAYYMIRKTDRDFINKKTKIYDY